MQDEINSLKAAEQQEVKKHSFERQWGGGLLLIGLGLFFLVQNIWHFSLFHNWWALFILIPALANFGQAWRSYQTNGRLNRKARGEIVGGFCIMAVALIFLLGLNWGVVWPIFIIIAGLGAWLKAC